MKSNPGIAMKSLLKLLVTLCAAGLTLGANGARAATAIAGEPHAVTVSLTPAAATPPNPDRPVAAASAGTAALADAKAKASVEDENDDDDDDAPAAPDAPRPRHSGNTVFSLGEDANLAAGKIADAVIAIGGNANSVGDVRDAVVAIFGNVRATGAVGDSVVAVLGDAYLNSSARSVVAVLGNVELGPQARVSREVVAIGGTLTRDPAATVSGHEQVVSFGRFGHLDGLRTWIKRCLLLGRPLALDPSLGWAWGIALAFLAFYALLALMFREAIQRCVDTMETSPGRATVASLVAMVLTPVALVVLAITVIGVVLIPFVSIALFCAALFGKAVMLTWIGRRVYRDPQPVIPLLIGGVIVLALYLVPFLGFIVYKVLGILGTGVVLYTLLMALRAGRASMPPPQSGAPPPVAAAAGEFASTLSDAPPVGASTAAAAGAAAAGATATASAAPAAPVIDYSSLPRAGFWPRMGALFLDAMLMALVLNVVTNPGGRAFFGCMAIYAAVMWQFKGTTIGGSILGLKLIRVDGRPIDWATAISRALGCLLSMAIAGLGFIWILFDGERQAWHDKIAGTVVVRVPKGVSLL